MTRIRRAGEWALHDAKARFSEVVRKAKTEGPQRITLHGRAEVVVVAIEEYRRLKEEPTGQAILDVFRDPRVADLDFELESVRSPVRDVEL